MACRTLAEHQAIQGRGLRLIQVRQPQYSFRNVPFCLPRLLLRHRGGPLTADDDDALSMDE
jgi:hypothetical protein